LEGRPLHILTPEQARLLTDVLNCIVPTEGVMPGAGDLGITTCVDEVLAQAPHLRRSILGLLTQLQNWEFTHLPDADKEALLRRLEQEQKAPFPILLQVAYNGYYSHPQVLEARGWVPPDESGYQLKPFDPKLLENVRQRGPIYKHI